MSIPLPINFGKPHFFPLYSPPTARINAELGNSANGSIKFSPLLFVMPADQESINIILDRSKSTATNGYAISQYQWTVYLSNGQTLNLTGKQVAIDLEAGPSFVQLLVSDNSQPKRNSFLGQGGAANLGLSTVNINVINYPKAIIEVVSGGGEGSTINVSPGNLLASVLLDGSESFASGLTSSGIDNYIASFSWKLMYASPADPTVTVNPNFNNNSKQQLNLPEGAYQFQLTVEDSYGIQSSVTVTFNVQNNLRNYIQLYIQTGHDDLRPDSVAEITILGSEGNIMNQTAFYDGGNGIPAWSPIYCYFFFPNNFDYTTFEGFTLNMQSHNSGAETDDNWIITMLSLTAFNCPPGWWIGAPSQFNDPVVLCSLNFFDNTIPPNSGPPVGVPGFSVGGVPYGSVYYGPAYEGPLGAELENANAGTIQIGINEGPQNSNGVGLASNNSQIGLYSYQYNNNQSKITLTVAVIPGAPLAELFMLTGANS